MQVNNMILLIKLLGSVHDDGEVWNTFAASFLVFNLETNQVNPDVIEMYSFYFEYLHSPIHLFLRSPDKSDLRHKWCNGDFSSQTEEFKPNRSQKK